MTFSDLGVVVLTVLLTFLLPDLKWLSGTDAAGPKPRPNVLFILTDDQDLQMDSLSAMPQLNKLLGEGGTTYQRHYCTVSLCCPSRVNLLTGRAAQ